jgi:hypothetical protein
MAKFPTISGPRIITLARARNISKRHTGFPLERAPRIHKPETDGQSQKSALGHGWNLKLRPVLKYTDRLCNAVVRVTGC